MGDRRYISYGRQWIDDDDVAAVTAVLRGDWLTTGPVTEQFEQALAEYCDTQHAVAVSSGTAALHAAYASLDLGENDEIVTSPLTFAATATTALHLGATITFADIDEQSGNIAPEAIGSAVSDKTKLVVAVDYAGHPADYDAINAITDPARIKTVADAAHSLGGRYKGRPVGRLADANAISFHPVKAITTAEGGAVITNDGTIARRTKRFRNHGIVRDQTELTDPGETWYYEIQELGLNYRMPDVLCALGLSQIAKLDRFIARRREIAARYTRELESISELELPVELDSVESAWHLYVVRVRDAARRDVLFRRLQADGLGVQLHYFPVYLHPIFRELGYSAGLCPVAEQFAARAISIPIFPRMTDDDVERVIELVRRAAGELL
ncbi:MAG: UDP-4-amino-4,6-dideoxy-N-acetyl-beta-L-altrosamine transaminase [Gammaproteobacteria bacterium]